MTAIVFKDRTITHRKGNSVFTDKIVAENKEYYTVVGIGSGEKLWESGYAVGSRVYKKNINLN
jgi:hypothetical protein